MNLGFHSNFFILLGRELGLNLVWLSRARGASLGPTQKTHLLNRLGSGNGSGLTGWVRL